MHCKWSSTRVGGQRHQSTATAHHRPLRASQRDLRSRSHWALQPQAHLFRFSSFLSLVGSFHYSNVTLFSDVKLFSNVTLFSFYHSFWLLLLCCFSQLQWRSPVGVKGRLSGYFDTTLLCLFYKENFNKTNMEVYHCDKWNIKIFDHVWRQWRKWSLWSWYWRWVLGTLRRASKVTWSLSLLRDSSGWGWWIL